MTKEMKRPTSHISGNSIKPALSKAVEFYTDNNIQAYECIRERDDYIDYLERKLNNASPQQALPVVPECVAEFIEGYKKEGECLFGIFADATRVEHDMPDLVYFWLGDEGNNDELFARAWLDGYTVEKPKLFYLKNKMTGLNLVLEQSFNATGKHVGERFREFDMQYIATDEQEARLYKNTFSKAEINNMDAGSYDLVPVEDGE